MTKQNLTKIRESICECFKKAWSNLCLVVILLLLLDIILIGLVFWQYCLEKEDSKINVSSELNISQFLLNQFDNCVQQREINFEESATKEYINLFNPR